MARILSFAGRQHHYERLKSVVNLLRARGNEVAYLVADNTVQNNDTAIEYLIPAGEVPIHVMQHFKRDDVADVTAHTHQILESVIGKRDNLQADVFAYVEPYWIAASVREACEVMVAFRHALDDLRPDALMILHEANFWTKMLAYLGNERGIPVISFQEGLLRHRDQATSGKFNLSCEYSTKVLMWSQRAKDAYIASGIPDSRLGMVGIPHMDMWYERQKATSPDEYKIVRAQLWASHGFRRLDEPIILVALPLLSRMDGNPLAQIGLLGDWSANTLTQIALRLHPFENPNAVARLKDVFRLHPMFKILEGGDTLELAYASDLVLSQHTTVAIETLALGRPLAELDLENAGVLESLSEQGVAIRIGGGELDKLTKILKGEIGVNLAPLAHWLDVNVGPRDGRASERAADEILALCRTAQPIS